MNLLKILSFDSHSIDHIDIIEVCPAPRTAQEFMQLVEYIGKPYEIEVKYDIVNDYRF